MSLAIALDIDPPNPVPATGGSPAPDSAVIDAAIDNACNKIAPLWPLKHFVAVNPFLGFSDRSFAATCATLRRPSSTDNTSHSRVVSVTGPESD